MPFLPPLLLPNAADAQIISASVVSEVFTKLGRVNQFSQATGSSAAGSQAELDGTPPVALDAELRVLDAFEMPRVEYDSMRKQYYRLDTPSLSLQEVRPFPFAFLVLL